MIPFPPFNHIQLGPLSIQLYGILIAFAITTCYYLALKLAKKRSVPTSEIDTYLLILIPSAFIGARIYHVITNWNYYQHNLLQVPAVWNGGLGILGGIITSTIATIYLAKKYNRSIATITDLLVTVLPLGQTIGRWGNYFNQELYGKPTTLPWSLSIDKPHRIPKYQNIATYHPTFLYESILNIFNFTLLYYLYKKQKLKNGIITALYLINYGLIRIIIEYFKIDPDTASQYGPLRIPQYISIIAIIVGMILITKILLSTLSLRGKKQSV